MLLTSVGHGAGCLSEPIATLGVAALIGLAVFGTMLWRTLSIETVTSAHAHVRFDAIRAMFPLATLLVRRDESGRFVRTEASGRDASAPARRLYVLAYSSLRPRTADCTTCQRRSTRRGW
jgi:hypothetical protein